MKIEVRKPQDNELDDSGILNWPIWECEPSTFDWAYSDKETCYLLEGEVTVKTDSETVNFSAGDIVVFPAGLSCVWEVKKVVRKHYEFG
ncbi:MAG: cupin domain-containing protein [gamma proteobacterium symbiont of Taylorina sp.]|nr:cupin domain-containing protein [gamma proteobacterium symbiont of Taylorina sp.]